MRMWEYKVLAVATKLAMNQKGFDEAAEQFEAELNRLGAEGWELVQRQDGMFFLKREL